MGPSTAAVGMATCSKEAFLSGSSLSFQVVARVAVVLDRRSVDTGQVLGVLCEDDIACPGLLEQDWVMLGRGSWVRHPKARGSRIRLRRDGWLAVRHESYGELLHVFPSGRARALFEGGGFATVPPARLPKSAGAAVPAGAAAGGGDAPAGPGGVAAAVGAEDLPALAEEPLGAHMKSCEAQHWEVVHESAHMRAHFQRGARLLVTIGLGGVVCLGSRDGPAPSSPDGRWVRCAGDAKVWGPREALRPRLLLGGPGAPAEAYLLKELEEHEILRRLDPPPRPRPRPRAGPPADGPGRDPHFELRRRLATEDSWTVARGGAGVHAERSEGAAAELWLQSGDVVFSGGDEEPAVWLEPNRRWLQLPAGAQVFRDGQCLHSLQARGFVLLEEGGAARLERGREPDAAAVVRLVAGFGEPWEVVHDAVGALAELEVRGRAPLGEGPRRAGAGGGEVRQVLRGDPGCRAWVRAEDAGAGGAGPPLRRCAAPASALAARLLGEERRELYREVLGLCHRRIYLENLEGLWGGDSARLPALETLELKLFEGSSRVVHVAKAGGFCGGAVIRELPVRAQGADGSPAQASVCYIDMCAARPGSHAGGDIWELLVSMKYSCIACHPILLQSTVDFWQGCGMRRFDATSERDCDVFRRQVLEHTGGLVCELPDVQECLPSSKLPLFIFVSRQFVQPRARLGELL